MLDVRAFWRPVLVLLALGSLLSGTSAGASVPGRHRGRRVPVVLRSTWHLIAATGAQDVVVSGRYVFIGGVTGSAAVIDEQTGKRVELTPPAGCSFSDDTSFSSPLGGSWLVAGCDPSLGAPGYELYSIPRGSWTPFSPDVRQMCALNAECATGDPDCSESYLAVGERWIEFDVTCGYHSYPSTAAFQQIQSGQVRAVPAGVGPGGNQILNLNSSTLRQRLCHPLRLPSAGTFVPDGRFALAEEYQGNTYLERCGSHLNRPLGPSGELFTANSRAVLWSPFSNGLEGLFLPSLHRFKLRLPQPVASLCKRLPAYLCVQGLALTNRTLYVLTYDQQVWTAKRPLQPAPTRKPRRCPDTSSATSCGDDTLT